MAQIFAPWANRLPFYLLVAAGTALIASIAVVWYFFSPAFTDVGYQPRQPVPFSHRLHAGELEVDCRYCHAAVEVARVASVPPTQTCMNCHALVARNSDQLAVVRESWESGEPIHWVKVHQLPAYAYFDHSPHVAAGVGCVSCHGDVTRMEEIRQVQPLSMSWCLDCHLDPTRAATRSVGASGRQTIPPRDCSGCHR